MKPSVLIVANSFPPDNGAGVYRTLGLCKHLGAKGWGITVIATESRPEVALDYELCHEVPTDVRVIRTPDPSLPELVSRLVRRGSKERMAERRAELASIPSPRLDKRISRTGRMVDWLSWWLHVPDRRSGWFLAAVWLGVREAWDRRPDVIFSTAPRWTSHLVGLTLSRLLRVPWVADFRDPWVGSPWHVVPYATQRKLDELLERSVIRHARRITCAWDGIRKHLVSRYPEKQREITTILNGFDPREADEVGPVRPDEERCVLLHVGTFYGPRSPFPLLQGLQEFQRLYPRQVERLLVVFMGHPDYEGRPLGEIVADYGVGDLVRVLPRVSHREAIAAVKGADVALLFGQSGDPSMASVPAKVYEYVGAGRPVLAIGAGEEACGIIRQGGCRLWAVNEGDTRAIVRALKKILADYGRYRLQGQQNWEARQAFTRDRMAKKLEAVMLHAIALSQGMRMH